MEEEGREMEGVQAACFGGLNYSMLCFRSSEQKASLDVSLIYERPQLSYASPQPAETPFTSRSIRELRGLLGTGTFQKTVHRDRRHFQSTFPRCAHCPIKRRNVGQRWLMMNNRGTQCDLCERTLAKASIRSLSCNPCMEATLLIHLFIF